MAVALAGRIARPADILDTIADVDPVTFSPSWSNLTKGTGWTDEGWYLQIGRQVTIQYTITLGTSPSFASTLLMTLPVACITSTLDTAVGSWVYRDDSLTDWPCGTVVLTSASTVRLAGAWNGTAPINTVGQTSSTPASPAVGDKISMCLSYLSAS